MLGTKCQMFCAGALAVFALMHLKAGDTDKAIMPIVLCLGLIGISALDDRK